MGGDASPGLLPILLLVGSNLFMTLVGTATCVSRRCLERLARNCRPCRDLAAISIALSWRAGAVRHRCKWRSAYTAGCTQDSNADQGKPEKVIARSSKRSLEAVNTSTRG